MHRPTAWRATVSSFPSLTTGASRRVNRRFASSFAARTSARATGTLVRWGLAGAAVYYYNTSNVFADEPRYATQAVVDTQETYSSIDAIAEQRRAQAKRSSNESAPVASNDAATTALESPDGLKEEAQQQGAFNEETGEINWDCPCLGGMAHGPCGDQFRAAFSCFVFSKEEPKGVDCIEHFKTMQNCFREHPDIYGTELDDDDGSDLPVDDAPQPGPQHAVDVAREHINDTVEQTADAISADVHEVTSTVREAAKEPLSPTKKATSSRQNLSTGGHGSEGELVPKAWHDSTGDNESTTKK